jgi:CheY-like chemotaxis protein
MKRVKKILIVIFAIVSAICAAQSTDKAINECEFQIIKYEKEGNRLEMAKYHAKLGFLYMDARNFEKAIDNFQKAIKDNEDLGNVNAIKTICTNIGMIYSETEDYQQALTYFRKSQRINEKQGKKSELAADLINIGQALQGQKKYDESNKNIEQALGIAQELSDIQSIKVCYGMLSENYGSLGKQDKSKEYFELASTLKGHLQKEELKQFESRTKQAEAVSYAKEAELQTKDKKIKELSREQQLTLELLNKQKELMKMQELESLARERVQQIKERNTLIIILSLGLLIVIISISLFFIFRQLREKKAAYLMIEESNQQILEQKKVIEVQRDIATNQKKKITDSILYAKRIQTAILPPISHIEKVFPEHFILFKPRDIVSGDFYWMTEKEGIVIIAVADCTGHGVPGAFMSMLGVAYLNEIVNKIAINKHIKSLQANEILNQLKQNVINSLHQTGKSEESKDGMDIALCVIDMENRHMQFAGAHNPVYIVRNNELINIAADKMPIGIYKNPDSQFTNKDIDLELNDMVYLFSDGYYDQFGGSSNMKMFSANFRNILLEIYKKPVADQRQILEDRFEAWKGDLEQVDDVMVMGLKITPKRVSIPTQTEYIWDEKKILIAEDVDVNYFLLVQALKPTKAHVFRASNGKEAVEFCKSNEVDIILMDIRMPVMDGIEATRQIRQFRKDIPIIAQTAQFEPGDSHVLIEAGCNDLIQKPIDHKTFLATIKKYIIKS